jgi:hypothetical protein
MMNKISGISDKVLLSGQQKAERSDGASFKKTLNNILEGKGMPDIQPAGREPHLGEPSAAVINGIAYDENLPGTDVAARTDHLLRQLDDYSRDLEDPRRSLKEMEPLIHAIRDDAQQLLDAASKAEKDPGLKEIATRVAMTANVEYMKFNRGDYS